MPKEHFLDVYKMIYRSKSRLKTRYYQFQGQRTNLQILEDRRLNFREFIVWFFNCYIQVLGVWRPLILNFKAKDKFKMLIKIDVQTYRKNLLLPNSCSLNLPNSDFWVFLFFCNVKFSFFQQAPIGLGVHQENYYFSRFSCVVLTNFINVLGV